MRELGGMKGVRLKDITYGNVCEKSLRNTETCWTAKDPVRQGHAAVGKTKLEEINKKTTALVARKHTRKLDKPEHEKRNADTRLRASWLMKNMG